MPAKLIVPTSLKPDSKSPIAGLAPRIRTWLNKKNAMPTALLTGSVRYRMTVSPSLLATTTAPESVIKTASTRVVKTEDGQ